MPRWLIVFFILSMTALPASNGRADSPVSSPTLAESLGFKDGDVGFIVIDQSSGKTVLEKAADSPFIPASVAKLATVYAAEQILGSDDRFRTKLYRHGSDLFLQGGGDPVLTINDLQALTAQLRSETPTGGWTGFYYDSSLVQPRTEISTDQPLSASYNPGIGALNVDFNRIAVEWSAHTGGEASRAGKLSFTAHSVADNLDVPVDWITFSPAPGDLPPGAPMDYAGDDTTEGWLYANALPDRGRIFLPVKHADLNTARIFRRLAQMAGLDMPEPRAAKVPPGAAQIGEIDSRQVSELVPGLLRYSNNLSAEMIGLAATRHITGSVLSLSDSSSILTDWLKHHLPSIDWRGFYLANHSGLSTRSRATPRQVAALLMTMARDPLLATSLPLLQGSRPIASPSGGDMTASNTPPMEVFGKSGTMNYVAGLAGYLTAHDGRRMTFAIFILDRDRRMALDATLDRRILEPTPEMRDWTRRARLLQSALIENWATAQ